MKHRFKTRESLFCGALLALFAFAPAQLAHADLGYWSNELVGSWRHPSNGDEYRFNSDATYSFFAGPAKRRAGNLSHSGWWKIVHPTQEESGGSQEGPVALRLKSTQRTVLEGSKKRVLKANRTFRIVVNTILSEDGQESDDGQKYYIGGAVWKRVR